MDNHRLAAELREFCRAPEPERKGQFFRKLEQQGMVEAGVNIKVIQDALGHKDIQTTMNIYADVTRELKKSEFEGLDGFFKKNREDQQDE